MTDLAAVLSRVDQIQALLYPAPPAPASTAVGSSGGAGFGSVLASVAGSPGAGVPSGVPTVTGASPSGAAVVADAQQYLGVPYVWGGTSTSGFDCSGLVQHVYADLGISLPRTSEEQAQVGQPVASLADARPGDLVFFAGSDGTATSPGHVGIYAGNGEMIDAPYTGTRVRVEPVSDAGPVVAIRRVVGGPAPASPAGSAAPAALAGVGGYAQAFASAGAAYGVPATLLASVARVESGLDPSAVSPAGAVGLMQLMPATASGLGVDPLAPTQAIDGAARLLSDAYQRFGSWPLAVAAYNAGTGAVAQYGSVPPYPQTQAYVQKVLAGAGMAS